MKLASITANIERVRDIRVVIFDYAGLSWRQRLAAAWGLLTNSQFDHSAVRITLLGVNSDAQDMRALELESVFGPSTGKRVN